MSGIYWARLSRLPIWDPIKKGIKGGFAVGGYQKAKAAERTRDFFRVTNDSIRVWVNDDVTGKGIKGGFAVGGYQKAKAGEVEHLWVGNGVTRVNGTFELFGEFVNLSDERMKENVETIDDALELVSRLEGVYYDWNKTAKETYTLDDSRQIGVLAQDLEQVIPELVTTNESGYKMVDYPRLTAVLVEAVKEQQEHIDQLEEQSKKIAELELKIKQLETMINSISE